MNAILLTCDKNDITLNLFNSLSDRYIIVGRVCETQVVPSTWCDLRRPSTLFVLIMLSAIDVRTEAYSVPYDTGIKNRTMPHTGQVEVLAIWSALFLPNLIAQVAQHNQIQILLRTTKTSST